ncbi:MAG: SGNH/GDSL hydrolase family protein, partial [Gemmatimonadaceae bacterium]
MSSRALTVVVAVVGIVIGFVLMEGTIRLYARIDPTFATGMRQFDPLGVQIEPLGRLGYRQRPNGVFHYGNRTVAHSNSLGYRGPEVSRTPDSGVVRIVLFGGSTTHGFGVTDDETIDAYMRAIYRQRDPSHRYEVVNLGFDGYDSYQDLERLRSDGLPMRPTVVVFNAGINDVRNARFQNLADPDPRTLIWEPVLARLRADAARGRPEVWSIIKHYSFVARTPGYVRNQLAQRSRQLGRRRVDQQLEDSLPAQTALASSDEPRYLAAADQFERHVREMVRLSLEQGVKVVLSTPASALREYPPNAVSDRDYWIANAKMTQDYRDELDRRLRLIDTEEEARGDAVRYLSATVPFADFLDDCHLKPEGNRMV